MSFDKYFNHACRIVLTNPTPCLKNILNLRDINNILTIINHETLDINNDILLIKNVKISFDTSRTNDNNLDANVKIHGVKHYNINLNTKVINNMLNTFRNNNDVLAILYYECVKSNNLELVKYIEDKYKKLDYIYVISYLLICMYYNYYDLFRYICKIKNTYLINNNDVSRLMNISCVLHQHHITEYLIDFFNVTQNDMNDDDYSYLLESCCFSGNIKSLECIHKKLNVTTEIIKGDYNKCLRMCCMKGYLFMVKYLHDNFEIVKYDIFEENYVLFEFNVLTLCYMNKKYDILDYLIKRHDIKDDEIPNYMKGDTRLVEIIKNNKK